MLSESWKEIKLQVLMVSLWLSITIVRELWKEMSKLCLKNFINTVSLKNLLMQLS